MADSMPDISLTRTAGEDTLMYSCLSTEQVDSDAVHQDATCGSSGRSRGQHGSVTSSSDISGNSGKDHRGDVLSDIIYDLSCDRTGMNDVDSDVNQTSTDVSYWTPRGVCDGKENSGVCGAHRINAKSSSSHDRVSNTGIRHPSHIKPTAFKTAQSSCHSRVTHQVTAPVEDKVRSWLQGVQATQSDSYIDQIVSGAHKKYGNLYRAESDQSMDLMMNEPCGETSHRRRCGYTSCRPNEVNESVHVSRTCTGPTRRELSCKVRDQAYVKSSAQGCVVAEQRGDCVNGLHQTCSLCVCCGKQVRLSRRVATSNNLYLSQRSQVTTSNDLYLSQRSLYQRRNDNVNVIQVSPIRPQSHDNMCYTTVTSDLSMSLTSDLSVTLNSDARGHNTCQSASFYSALSYDDSQLPLAGKYESDSVSCSDGMYDNSQLHLVTPIGSTQSPSRHMPLDSESDATMFMQRPLVTKGVTGGKSNINKRRLLAKKLKKVGKYLHKLGHGPSDMKLLAVL